MSSMKEYICGGCFEKKQIKSWGSYIPRMCAACHASGYKTVPRSKREEVPWFRDEMGNRCRSVEGGA